MSSALSAADRAAGNVCVRQASREMGLGLFTTRPFSANAIVLDERPLVSMLEFHSTDPVVHCVECLRRCVVADTEDSETDDDALTCRACSIRWCSETCRQASAPWHRHLCFAVSPTMRLYSEAAEEACNEYFILAARLFAAPPTSRVEASLPPAIRPFEEQYCFDCEWPPPAISSSASGAILEPPKPSAVCAGLKGVPWWLTVDPVADRTAHIAGARELTELQCERLRASLPPGGIHEPTAEALSVAMGALRMNVIGVCVQARQPHHPAIGMGLFDLACRGERRRTTPSPIAAAARSHKLVTAGRTPSIALLALTSPLCACCLWLAPHRAPPFGTFWKLRCDRRAANHSCMPSARLACDAESVDVARVQMRATRELACGEEATIDYLAGVAGTSMEKRAQLQEQYCFDCACTHCREAEGYRPPKTA